MFRRWWFSKGMRPAAPAAGGPSRREARARRALALGEWEALREHLRKVAAERVTAAGAVFRAAELDLPAGEPAARRAYQWALEAYEAAGRLLDHAGDEDTDLPDLAAAVVLAEQSVERLAAAHLLHAGRRPDPPAVRCYWNPLHGPAEPAPGPAGNRRNRKRAHVTAREAAADRRPTCRSCRAAILAGQQPDVLPALLPAKAAPGRKGPLLVPYFAVPRQWSPWSTTACGAYDPDTPALVLRGEHRRPGPR
ncbi:MULTISPECIES: hypothetical protein [Kitasatospora]|uniref:Uncharacterized protein n=1 Tax=Kitasatospora setae (strain ATCC 33774 / DSM 43861 / JCM 3304 / KCC A-0304 / NBRC 14216 / KM-6054) TaxID=452652 RepID=E4NGZ4_KITSK|nr:MULTISPECIES: hypothetical protein [Kitasatospora]BAJ30774.1 hypothetical protein KSE_49960 [Kitasatospora setae KM-6054]